MSKDVAAQVHAAAIAALDERETEHLREMLANTDVAGVDEADLETLRDAYKDNADEIWLSDDLEDGAHEADDYYQGYVAGARMVIEIMLEAFGIDTTEERGQ